MNESLHLSAADVVFVSVPPLSEEVTFVSSPQSETGSVPRLPRTHPDKILFVDVLQELHIQALVAHFGITKVTQILRRK